MLSGKNKLWEDDAEMCLLCTRLDGALHRAELAQLLLRIRVFRVIHEVMNTRVKPKL